MTDTPRSPRRRAVLEELRRSGSPLAVTDLAERLEVHPNTVRFHLDALVTEGTVERLSQEASGPGRPRAVYAPRPGMDRGGVRGYRLLAEILVSRLAAAGPAAETEAAEAGRAWGRYLIGPPPPFRGIDAGEAEDRLRALLAELGFAPTPAAAPVPARDPAPDPARGHRPSAPGRTAGPIRLTHCPFLELAEEHQRVVCPLHLGLMQGALTALRAPLDVARLEPFAEPDACLAHLTPTVLPAGAPAEGSEAR